MVGGMVGGAGGAGGAGGTFSDTAFWWTTHTAGLPYNPSAVAGESSIWCSSRRRMLDFPVTALEASIKTAQHARHTHTHTSVLLPSGLCPGLSA